MWLPLVKALHFWGLCLGILKREEGRRIIRSGPQLGLWRVETGKAIVLPVDVRQCGSKGLDKLWVGESESIHTKNCNNMLNIVQQPQQKRKTTVDEHCQFDYFSQAGAQALPSRPYMTCQKTFGLRLCLARSQLFWMQSYGTL